MTRGWHHHGSDTPTSPRAVLLHTDQIFYTFLHTTVHQDMQNSNDWDWQNTKNKRTGPNALTFA